MKNPRVSLRPAPRLSKAARRQLRRGIAVEMEHTRSRKAARTIAAQHLAESPRYYRALARMEGQLKANPPIPYEDPNPAGMRVLRGFRPATQRHEHTCGPACLRAVLAWRGTQLDEAALASLAGTSKRHGTTPAGMLSVLHRATGTPVLRRNASVAWCLRQLRRDRAVLLLWNDWKGHWVTLIGYDPTTKRLLLADPANRKTGLRIHTYATFAKHWRAKVAGTLYRRLAIAVA